MASSDPQSELFDDAECVTRLVPDGPAEQDAFGPHRSVARAMATMVLSEDGGHSVGLAGRWGAGKSTVIRLLREHLAASPGYRTWIFDAWAHEGDPLRRTFLESLIGFLSREGWIDDARWSKKTAELAKRWKESRQHTSPRLSRMGRMLALSAATVPLGTALFAQGLRTGVAVFRFGLPLNWLVILGALLGLGPLWVIAGGLLRLRYRYWRASKRGESPDEPDYNSVFAVFVQKAVTETITETSETTDPTSIEFERIFGDLMDDALSDEQRRLVLVVDNLDRVEPSEALRIWSTLQTFLQHRIVQQAWLPRLWVVMPFDSQAIRRLWEKEEASGGGLATSFLEKSFQIQFDVPAPLMSDWREYLLSALRSALPDPRHTDDEFHTIYRLIAVLRGAGDPPTPRELKVIVNQIGALHRLRRHAVPLTHMAYYVLLMRRPASDIVTELRAGDLPRRAEAGLLGEGVQDNLAALAFGVEQKKARQFLLQPPLLEALAHGDAAALRGLVGAEGFQEVLEEVLAKACSDWPAGEGGNVLNAFAALTDAGLLEDRTSYRTLGIERQLLQGARHIERLAPVSPVTERGLVMLAQRIPNPDDQRQLFDCYARAATGFGEPVDDAGAASFVSRTVAVARGFMEAGFDLDASNGIPVPGRAESFINVYRALLQAQTDPDGSILRMFASAAEDLPARLIQAAKQGAFRKEHRHAALAAIRHGSKTNWTPLLAALRERLDGSNTLPMEELLPVLGTLVDHRHLPGIPDLLKSLTLEGHLGHHMYVTSKKKAMEGLATCLYAHMLVAPALKPPGRDVGQSAAGYTRLATYLSDPPEGLPEALADLLYGEEEEALLITALEANPSTGPLVADALGALVEREECAALFTPQLVYDHWPLLADRLEQEPLLRRTNADTDLITIIGEHGFSAERATLYAAVLGRGDYPEFRAWCAAELRALASDEWLEELREDGGRLRLAQVCQAQGERLDLAGPLRTALVDLATELAGGDERTPQVEAWTSVLDLLEQNQRDVALEQLYGIVQENASDVREEFFSAFGKELTASGLLSKDRAAFTKVLEPFIEARNVHGLRWVDDQVRAAGADALRDLTKQSLKVLKSRLMIEMEEGTADDAHEVLRSIANGLNVRPGKTKPNKATAE